MTAQKIQSIALQRFAKQGFTATSMNEIAEDVGIKKPSIYAHFKNKDDLYLSLIPIMINHELTYAKNTLTGGENFHQQLCAYFCSIGERFDASYDVQFWMNALINPPQHIYDQVIDPMHIFMDDLENIFKNVFPENIENKKFDSTTLARLCMCFVDALQSELIYGGKDKYKKRLDAILKALEVLIG
ncbi:TetR/AcrR family transcriptional regulator [Acinetobacter sp. ULE_I001]|uniref:TetR/AcrR family transcriptional regulator n=1 Tax=Acinetobacter TaxID=469 RepID=UPI0006F935B3|nr:MULTISPECIES: TetR/AcrR family transcriptional regulator [Acinetobacter]KQX03202.1 TetR family transcriptional regulator [Acinetobacter sp. Root1280]